jgi:hypothetical protein
MPWRRRRLLVTSLPATEEISAMGLEVESRQGICGLVALKKLSEVK